MTEAGEQKRTGEQTRTGDGKLPDSARPGGGGHSGRTAGGTDRIGSGRHSDAARTWIDAALTRVGILGGTFDPIHYGHLAIAEEVAEALDLERILFVPAALPPHKLDEEVATAEDRAAMAALAIAGNPTFELSRIELERDGPSYTADTLQELADEAARQRVVRELYFILSADALAGFRGWFHPERVVALATLVVVPRPGAPGPDEEWTRAQLPPNLAATARVRTVDTVPIANSSTSIRELALAGLSIRYLVPPPVEAYIREHRLYRSRKPVRTA